MRPESRQREPEQTYPVCSDLSFFVATSAQHEKVGFIQTVREMMDENEGWMMHDNERLKEIEADHLKIMERVDTALLNSGYFVHRSQAVNGVTFSFPFN